ncbi:MAG: hypothetical protein GW801_14005 [Sphingomonadales bacterium]|nr:hypothetical protein [Sphingomonadales bacterium]NCP28308.1 hypothetical protein [Sphingomonadales bacterium]NCQ22485.1 hypothetical protein [Sphingomonadales bacterium]NCQ63472.1 hypothetical protein [Alphaproteobacteria bacterium]
MALVNHHFAIYPRVTRETDETMKIFIPVAAILALGACGSQDEALPEPEQAESVVPADVTEAHPPPHREEFAAAWAEACLEAEPVGKALCKSKGLGEPGFTCDFGLGEDEYRRHNAELELAGESWALVDPENACNVE